MSKIALESARVLKVPTGLGVECVVVYPTRATPPAIAMERGVTQASATARKQPGYSRPENGLPSQSAPRPGTQNRIMVSMDNGWILFRAFGDGWGGGKGSLRAVSLDRKSREVTRR